MRFAVDIVLKTLKEELLIPTDYRKNIASLIKEAINSGEEKSELYEKYYENKIKNVAKPFTFSLFIPKHKIEKRGENKYLVLDSNIIKFFFSSNDYRFLLEFYNGLLNINSDFTLFDYLIEFNHFHLKKQSPVKSNIIKFETLSPVVVRNIEEKKGKGYVTYKNENFKEMLFFNIRNICQNFMKSDFELKLHDFDINLLDCKVAKIFHYNEIVPCTKGIFEIKAPKEVLNLIYDVGLGARRSQGFGMIEVYENC